MCAAGRKLLPTRGQPSSHIPNLVRSQGLPPRMLWVIGKPLPEKPTNGPPIILNSELAG